MTGLLGPNGRPISSEQYYKKEKPKAFGPAFGQWFERDVTYNQMPGGAVLQFNLDGLTLDDFRAMRHHPQINANLSLISFMVHQADWRLSCPKDKAFERKMDESLRPLWTRLVRGMSQAFWAGFSPIAMELENNVNEKRVDIDKFKDLRPEDCQVNWKKVKGSYRPVPGAVPPTFNVYDGIKQFGTQNPIPPENTLWYPLLMENGNMYGRKLLKAAFTPWYFSTLIHLFANRYFERFGEPVPIGRAPFDEEFPISSGSNETISAKEAMETVLMNLRNRGTVVLPNDIQLGTRIAGDKTAYAYSIEYLESQMRGADFERYLLRLDEEISLALFQPILLMRTGDVGSNNLGVQHTQTWLWTLNALTGDMKEYIDRYVIHRLASWNHPAGENHPPIEWVPRKMGKESVETLRTVINELLTDTSSGTVLRPDIDELGVALGMTLNEVKVVTRDNPDPSTSGDNPNLDRPSEPPRGVGEPRATGREVSARVRQQVTSAWRNGNFRSDMRLDMGYKRRMVQSCMAEGMTYDQANRAVEKLYSRMESVSATMVSLGKEEYASPKDFMAIWDRTLDTEIDALAS